MKLTETERIILENTDERYKYIARDETGILVLYVHKPKKYGDVNEWVSDYFEQSFSAFNHLFQSIQWEDEKPLRFRNKKGEFLL